MELVQLVLRNACLTSDNQDLDQARDLWCKLGAAGDRWSEGWMLQALAATQRTELTLAAYADHMYQDVQVGSKEWGWGREGPRSGGGGGRVQGVGVGEGGSKEWGWGREGPRSGGGGGRVQGVGVGQGGPKGWVEGEERRGGGQAECFFADQIVTCTGTGGECGGGGGLFC